MKKCSYFFLVLAILLPLHAEKLPIKTIIESEETDRRDFLAQEREGHIDRRDRLSRDRYEKCIACMETKKEHQFHKLELKLKD